MHSCSASSGKPDSNSLDCIVFSCFLMYRDWNKWNDEGFTFLVSDVSISWVYLLLQMLFVLPGMCNCIYIFLFLGFEDASFANFSSAAHVFDNLKMLLIEILHPQFVLSITCRYSPVKFCIFNLLKSTIADIFPHILWVAIYFTTWADT